MTCGTFSFFISLTLFKSCLLNILGELAGISNSVAEFPVSKWYILLWIWFLLKIIYCLHYHSIHFLFLQGIVIGSNFGFLSRSALIKVFVNGVLSSLPSSSFMRELYPYRFLFRFKQFTIVFLPYRCPIILSILILSIWICPRYWWRYWWSL